MPRPPEKNVQNSKRPFWYSRTPGKKPGVLVFWVVLMIPVRDARGRIQALQRRMDDSGEGKYLFSSSNGTSGTPAYVARPKESKSKRV